jgi:hypothetical protein
MDQTVQLQSERRVRGLAVSHGIGHLEEHRE